MTYRYSLLPTHNNGPDSPRIAPTKHIIVNVFHSRRYARFSLFMLFSLACCIFILPHDTPPWLANLDQWIQRSSKYPPYPIPRDTPPEDDTRPPLFERYSAYERKLPQHDNSLSFPDDSGRRYLYFDNSVWGVGWGNAMQELILNAQLAYESGRTFVFSDYSWAWLRETEYEEYNGKLIPAKIPLSALLAGPIAGGPYSNSTIAETHPRSVSWHYFNKVCPQSQRYILDPRELIKTMPFDPSATHIMSFWVEKLQNMEHRCIEFQKGTAQIFDFWLFGTTRLHDIVPSLINSPIMKDFAWSPLTHYVFQRNQDHFADYDLISNNLVPTPPASHTRSLPLLALHLRRGDFIEHCDKLNGWNSNYTGFNTLPDLPDRLFMENATLVKSMTPEEKKEAYNAKCLVDIDKVRKRVIRAVKEWREERLRVERESTGMIGAEERVKRMLRKVYVMTNGDREFLEELKAALIADAQRSMLQSHSEEEMNASPSISDEYDFDFAWTWDEVSTSRDLDIGWETKHIAQALDMYVGQRAEVFVGNGFSSLTAGVVLLRTVTGVEPWRTRFW